jgi:hypothetical protein
MTNVRLITPQETRSQWTTLEPLFQRALNMSKCSDYNIDDVYQYLVLNQWRCYVAEEQGQIRGAAVVSMMRYPHDTVAYVCAIGGRMLANEETSKQFFDLLKQHGAARVQGAARPSIVRLWRRIGLEEKYSIVEAKL